MADDELAGRTLVRSNADFAVPIRGCYANHEMLAGVLSAALAESPSVHLFDDDGRIALFVAGGLHIVDAALLREIIRANLVTEGLRVVDSVVELEYRPIEASEVVVRTMLTSEKHGLTGKLPLAALRRGSGRQAAAAVEEPPVPQGVEFERGRQRAAHFARLASQGPRLEAERGAARAAEFAEREARRRQTDGDGATEIPKA
jgi:hypothetical protein